MDEKLFTMGVLVVVSALRLAVALPLFFTARRNNLTNLYWLSAQFFALVIALPFAAVGTMDNRWIFWTFISFSEIALIMFIHTTFNQGRSSIFPLFLALAFIGLIGGAYGTYTNNFELSAWFVYPNAILSWLWHLVEASRAYNNIRKDTATEDWVKSRYRMMITYSVVDLISAIIGTLSTTNMITGSLIAVATVLLNFASVITQIFTWIMPEWFRKWLNRNQSARIQSETEEKVRPMLDLVGNTLEQHCGINKMMCLYIVRTSVGRIIGRENDSAGIESHIAGMGYASWEILFDSDEFQKLLANAAGGTNQNVEQMIQNTKQTLVEKQSLLTLSAQ